jgi:hypothetical protein
MRKMSYFPGKCHIVALSLPPGDFDFSSCITFKIFRLSGALFNIYKNAQKHPARNGEMLCSF